MWEFFLRVLDAVGGAIVGGILAVIAIPIGVVGLAMWAGWSRDRYCERKGWKDLGRF